MDTELNVASSEVHLVNFLKLLIQICMQVTSDHEISTTMLGPQCYSKLIIYASNMITAAMEYQ